MDRLTKTYLHIINEDNDNSSENVENDLMNIIDNNSSSDDKPIKEEKPISQNNNIITKENPTDNTDKELELSNELSAELINTINEFTQIASKIVKNHSVNKETSDKCYNLLSKIKNLLDAAKNSI